MILEALEGYAKMSNPWLQAWNATNAMSISEVRALYSSWSAAAH
jgi:hypothetical protein